MKLKELLGRISAASLIRSVLCLLVLSAFALPTTGCKSDPEYQAKRPFEPPEARQRDREMAEQIILRRHQRAAPPVIRSQEPTEALAQNGARAGGPNGQGGAGAGGGTGTGSAGAGNGAAGAAGADGGQASESQSPGDGDPLAVEPQEEADGLDEGGGQAGEEQMLADPLPEVGDGPEAAPPPAMGEDAEAMDAPAEAADPAGQGGEGAGAEVPVDAGEGVDQGTVGDDREGLPSRRRPPPPPEDDEFQTPLEGIVPAMPEREELPEPEVRAREPDRSTDDLLKLLVGTWVREGGPNAPDFLEGGYSNSQIIISAAGRMEFTRWYGGPNGVRLTRSVDYELVDRQNLKLGKEHRPAERSLIQRPVDLAATPRTTASRILPPRQKFPARVSFRVDAQSLVIDGRPYRRQAEPEKKE